MACGFIGWELVLVLFLALQILFWIPGIFIFENGAEIFITVILSAVLGLVVTFLRCLLGCSKCGRHFANIFIWLYLLCQVGVIGVTIYVIYLYSYLFYYNYFENDCVRFYIRNGDEQYTKDVNSSNCGDYEACAIVGLTTAILSIFVTFVVMIAVNAIRKLGLEEHDRRDSDRTEPTMYAEQGSPRADKVASTV